MPAADPVVLHAAPKDPPPFPNLIPAMCNAGKGGQGVVSGGGPLAARPRLGQAGESGACLAPDVRSYSPRSKARQATTVAAFSHACRRHARRHIASGVATRRGRPTPEWAVHRERSSRGGLSQAADELQPAWRRRRTAPLEAASSGRLLLQA